MEERLQEGSQLGVGPECCRGQGRLSRRCRGVQSTTNGSEDSFLRASSQRWCPHPLTPSPRCGEGERVFWVRNVRVLIRADSPVVVTLWNGTFVPDRRIAAGTATPTLQRPN